MSYESHDAGRSHPPINGRGHKPLILSTNRLVLWRLRGALDELACVVRCTPYGHTLGLELGGDLILLELQRNVEVLVDKADRLKAWLLTQGWQQSADEPS